MNREQYERELAERQQKHLDSLRTTTPWKPCAHDQCPKCHGTGISRWGACIHGLYCDCPKCSAR